MTTSAGRSNRASRLLRLLLSPLSRLVLLVVLLLAGSTVVLAGQENGVLGSLAGWRNAQSSWMPFVYPLVFALLTMVFVPRPALATVAGALFGMPVALAVAGLGTVLGAGISFGLGRALGRDALSPLLSRGKLRALDAQFARHGFLATVLCRLLPTVPFAAVNYSAALTRVQPIPFLAGTAVGTLPANSAYVAFGGALMTDPPSWVVPATVGFVMAGTGLAWAGRKYLVS